jgi:hypothetical protein
LDFGKGKFSARGEDLCLSTIVPADFTLISWYQKILSKIGAAVYLLI